MTSATVQLRNMELVKLRGFAVVIRIR